MQDPPSACAGKAQSVRSALSWAAAFGPSVPQALLEAMFDSSCAYRAHVSAHNGAAAVPERPHWLTEFWMMALQRTEVV